MWMLLISMALAGERLAVLELSGELKPQELALLSDEVRGAVVRSISGDILVMTRENMEVMLTDMGIDASCIAEGACEVETARNLGVDYVVSGSVVGMGGKQIASIKLHQTDNGGLLGSERATGADSLALLEAIDDTVVKLMQALAASATATSSQSAAAREVAEAFPEAPIARPSLSSAPSEESAAYCQEIAASASPLPAAPTARQVLLRAARVTGVHKYCDTTGFFLEETLDTVYNGNRLAMRNKAWRAPPNLNIVEMHSNGAKGINGYNGLFSWGWNTLDGKPGVNLLTMTTRPDGAVPYVAEPEKKAWSAPTRGTFAGQSAWVLTSVVERVPGQPVTTREFFSIATGEALGSTTEATGGKKSSRYSSTKTFSGWLESGGIRFGRDMVDVTSGAAVNSRIERKVSQFGVNRTDMPTFRFADFLRSRCDLANPDVMSVIEAIDQLEEGPTDGEAQWGEKFNQAYSRLKSLVSGGSTACS